MKDNSKAKAFVGMLDLQAGIWNNALDQLTDAAALKRPTSDTNHINWLLGHIVHCRFMLAGMIGANIEDPYGNLYFSALQDKSYPKIAEIARHWTRASEMLVRQVSSLTDSEMDRSAGSGKPTPADLISFFIYHEAYHLGQIGLVRKMIGLGALKSA